MITVGPSGSTVGAEDTSGTPPQTTVIIDSSAPVAGPLQVNTPTGLQDAHGKVWDPTVPLSVYVTIDESEARGESITLKYWRGTSDDVNMDGVADESEYLGQTLPLSSGMTGQQQVNFIGIDVSAQDFNSPVHMFIEGTDWAGLTYQEGGTGGSAGASNSWASVIVATDEPTVYRPPDIPLIRTRVPNGRSQAHSQCRLMNLMGFKLWIMSLSCYVETALATLERCHMILQEESYGLLPIVWSRLFLYRPNL